ncbi:MAG: hypothetical protein ACK5JF_10270 [Oscillospiraceae bacterium]
MRPVIFALQALEEE